VRVQKETARHPFLVLEAIIALLVLENHRKNVPLEHTIHSWASLVKMNASPVLLESSVEDQELNHFQVIFLETVTLDTSVYWV